MSKAIIHLVIDTEQLPDYEDKVCAAIDVYENGERTNAAYRINYEDLTLTEQQQWDGFVGMITTKEV